MSCMLPGPGVVEVFPFAKRIQHVLVSTGCHPNEARCFFLRKMSLPFNVAISSQ